MKSGSNIIFEMWLGCSCCLIYNFNHKNKCVFSRQKWNKNSIENGICPKKAYNLVGQTKTTNKKPEKYKLYKKAHETDFFSKFRVRKKVGFLFLKKPEWYVSFFAKSQEVQNSEFFFFLLPGNKAYCSAVELY